MHARGVPSGAASAAAGRGHQDAVAPRIVELDRAAVVARLDSEVREALTGLGLELDDLVEHEEEPGLGNGGLGRLAACFMDSLATLSVPAIGHGIRYEFGIFDQEIRGGWQHERADRWLRLGYPWEIRRNEIEHTVGLGGHTETYRDAADHVRVRWVPERVIKGVPSDPPIVGGGTANTNLLRLWTALADEDFDLEAFQAGEYRRAVEAKVRSENITKVLYPNDETPAGKQLRLGADPAGHLAGVRRRFAALQRDREDDPGAGVAVGDHPNLRDLHPMPPPVVELGAPLLDRLLPRTADPGPLVEGVGLPRGLGAVDDRLRLGVHRIGLGGAADAHFVGTFSQGGATVTYVEVPRAPEGDPDVVREVVGIQTVTNLPVSLERFDRAGLVFSRKLQALRLTAPVATGEPEGGEAAQN